MEESKSLTIENIFDMYGQLLMGGFIPDTMLVHPEVWKQWHDNTSYVKVNTDQSIFVALWDQEYNNGGNEYVANQESREW